MNIYYNPEKFNLEIFCEKDTGGAWEFDKSVVWRSKDNKYYFGYDSGCSWPTPFEGQGLSDLEEISEKKALAYRSKWW